VLLTPAPAPLRRSDVRLTVDTAADLSHVRELYARTGIDMPSLRQFIEAAGRPARTEVA
jgi:spore coat polysaccharide biosynthesis protein SpsF (cytidylyltransferase family)